LKEQRIVTSVHPFDLQARAELAARGLTALGDPRQQGLMYFLGEWRTKPPTAFHGLWDYGDGSGRQIDALTLVRAIVPAGSPAATPDEGENLLEAWLLRILKEDGLSWLPDEPWTQPWGKELLLADPTVPGPFCEISWAQRGTLLGLTTRYLATGDDRYRTLGQKMVDGLLRIALRDDHGLFYPEGYYQPSGWHYHTTGLHPAVEEYNAAVAISALRFFDATGYEPALELARDLTTNALYHTPCYLPDGRLRQTVGDVEGHFHTHSNFALIVLKLGISLGRREYVSWARQTYEVLREWGTDFGWFPEGFGHRHGEVCCFTDMIEIALLLGKHVDPAYYADAERFGRNHLLESQFTSLDRLQAAVDRLPASDRTNPANPAAWTQEGVTESQLGAFASRSTLSDALHLDATALMQCCNAAGARALYDLWRYTVDETPSGNGTRNLNVNLRFSVESPSLRVVSHEPATGRLDLTATEPARLSVRLPAGVTEAIAVLDTPIALTANNGYVTFDLTPGQTAHLHYALPERTTHYEIGTPARNERGIGHWRGETLLRMDPPGQFYPLYDRTTDVAPVQPSAPAGKVISSL
jgi:hypothetical protein